MNWWRAYHGIATDPKYSVVMRYIALRGVTGVTRSDVLAIWIWLIDFSSQNDDRGSIVGLDTAQISVTLDIPDEMIDTVISCFEQAGMITDKSLKSWNKRQPKREDESSERVREFRKRVTQGNAHETNGNAVTLSRGRPRDLLSSYSSSNTENTSVSVESSGEEWFEEIYSRHPKKKDRGIAANYLSEVSDLDRSEFDRVHKLWCAEWAKDKPQFAPTLAQWILDKGWRYPPNGNHKTPDKPYDPLAKLGY